MPRIESGGSQDIRDFVLRLASGDERDPPIDIGGPVQSLPPAEVLPASTRVRPFVLTRPRRKG